MKRSSKVIALALILMMALSTVSAFATTRSGEGKNITGATVDITSNSKTYNGTKGTVGVKVVLDGEELTMGTDYLVAGASTPSALAGTYEIKDIEIVGVGAYLPGPIFVDASYTIKEADQKLTASPSKKTVRYSKVKKRTQYVTIKTSGAKGKLVYSKVSGSKYLKVSSTGKISVKKKTKKGTYSIKVKVYAGSVSGKYNSATIYKTIKVVVK